MRNFSLVFTNILICIVNSNSSHQQANANSAALNTNYDQISESNVKAKGLRWMSVMFCSPTLPFLKKISCNGKQDCSDGSDETSALCQKNTCFKNEFRCNYGACISNGRTCNGIFDCADGSDEDEISCSKRDCILPTSTENTKYYISGCNNCKEGSDVEHDSILLFSCSNNFKARQIQVKCRNGEWFPYIPICTKNAFEDKPQNLQGIQSYEPPKPNLPLQVPKLPYNLPISISFVIPGQATFNNSNGNQDKSSETALKITEPNQNEISSGNEPPKNPLSSAGSSKNKNTKNSQATQSKNNKTPVVGSLSSQPDKSQTSTQNTEDENVKKPAANQTPNLKPGSLSGVGNESVSESAQT